jgi:DNA-binding response OmpR family regulator
MHALIIEDDGLIAMTIEEVLRDCGFTSFDVAGSLDKAVSAATMRCPQLITADVELQPGCGIDAVQTICSSTLIPVIFITGRSDRVRARMPDHPVLSKPFNVSDVEAAVRLALSQARPAEIVSLACKTTHRQDGRQGAQDDGRA